LKLARLFLAAFALLQLASQATAQTYPSRPVTLVVGYGAGGVTDAIGRALADGLTKALGQTFVVENRPGANSLVAAIYVKSAKPDGYVLFVGPVTGFHPIFMKSGMDASSQLAPVSMASFGDWYLYSPTHAGFSSLKELVTYAKANPDKLRSASPSTTNTLYIAIVAKALNIKVEDIKYKTTDQAIVAMLQDDTQLSFNGLSGFLPQIEEGKLRALATLSPQRTELLPNVPTMAEQGIPLTVRFTNGLWAPPGTPPEIVAKLNAGVAEALKRPEVIQRIKNASLAPEWSTPEALVEDTRAQMKILTEAAQQIGMQPE
jgi:tripartite-type tricarboxylate transporter receptor subunit TctC